MSITAGFVLIEFSVTVVTGLTPTANTVEFSTKLKVEVNEVEADSELLKFELVKIPLILHTPLKAF